ncbi:MAG TPA: cation transporter [Epsilonproteobacteria bacterium]|nr:cation transporter [Campylobacterota bacterium]
MSEHHHGSDLKGKNLFLAIVLNIAITVAQAVGGILSGSLALLSDALHNFSDVLSLLISYGANRLARKKGTERQTFGFRRAEIIATLFNASTLIAIGLYIIFEAFSRFSAPEPVDTSLVIWLGFLGIIVNGGSIFLLKEDAQESMNIKAAYLHLLGDVLTSVAVVIGGLLMMFWQIYWVDPIISILIAIYLMYASYGLVKDSTAILMQFAPKSLDLEEIVQTIIAHEQIQNAHHIHLWNLDDNKIHLEAHLDFTQNLSLKESNAVLEILEEELHEKYNIDHTVFQCEYERKDDKGRIKS